MTINDFINYLNDLNIKLTDKQLNQLEKYYELLVEYNKVMNLTGIVEHDQVYLKHFYDSLTIAKVINLNDYKSLCDIGTGAGFPGLVLKIVFPNLYVTLVDSLNKRINFLNKVIETLELENIETIHSRIEEYGLANREKFDLVTSRAVAPTNILLEYSIPILKLNGKFLCLKGTMETEPNFLKAMEKLDTKIVSKVEFLLPFENSKRTIITFLKLNKTNLKYPRKNLEIKNKPL